MPAKKKAAASAAKKTAKTAPAKKTAGKKGLPSDFLPEGTKCHFTGYKSPPVEGEKPVLKEGEIVTVLSYAPADKLYNVSNAEGSEDSVFRVELKTEEEMKASKKAAKVAKKVAKKQKVEVVPPAPVIRSESVKAALEEHKGNVCAAVKAVAGKKEHLLYTFGGLLAVMWEEKAFEAIQHKDPETKKMIPTYGTGMLGFRTFAQVELGLGARSAEYYRELYIKFSPLASEAKIAKIGWTKLRSLLPVPMTKDNVDEWLSDAKTLPAAQLEEKAKQAQIDAGIKLHGNSNPANMTRRTFVLFNDQATMIEDAVATAKTAMAKDGTADAAEITDGAALAHIVQEWQQLRDQ